VRLHGAHRVAYELVKGPIPEGKDLHHLCHNPPCVNPDHLQPVTPKEHNLLSENVTKLNTEKTHCPRGHPLAGDNLVLFQLRRGYRECLTCKREKELRWYYEHKK